MSKQPFSRPATGYASLWPRIDLGTDLAKAYYAIGVRSDLRATSAKGYALSISPPANGGAPQAVQTPPERLSASTLLLARLEAVHKAQGRPCTLYRAVGRGRLTLWEAIERIELLHWSQGDRLDDASEIRNDGTLIEKVLNPRIALNIGKLAEKLATTVTHDLSGQILPMLRDDLAEQAELFEFNVNNLEQGELADLISEVKSGVQPTIDAGLGLAAPQVTERFKIAIKNVHDSSQTYLAQSYFPQTAISFRQVDELAVDRMGNMNGWYVRNSSGQASDYLSKQAGKIAQEGLKQGIGSDVIAAQMIKKLPDFYNKWSFNYARTVARAGLSRARSYSEVSAYRQAGITYLEIVAMLDERTTDVCRSLDGTIVEVSEADAALTAQQNLTNPTDIKDTAPFLAARNNPQKQGNPRELWVSGKPLHVATISRSGVGNVDDRGDFKRHMGTKDLNKAGVTVPPFHFNCRSMTVPRVEMVQVPGDREPHTEPTPSAEDHKPPPKPKPTAPKPKPQQRPVTTKPIPTPKKPVAAGMKKPIDNPAPRKPGTKPAQEAKPEKTKPKTLKEYNKQLIDLQKSVGANPKIDDIKLDKTTGQLVYSWTDKTDGSKRKFFVNVDPDQHADLEKRLRYRGHRQKAKTKPVPTPPKPTNGLPAFRRTTAGSSTYDKWDEDTAKMIVEAGGQVPSRYRDKMKPLSDAARKRERTRVQSAIIDQIWQDPDVQAVAKGFGASAEQMRKNPRAAVYKFSRGITETWAATSKDSDIKMHYLQIATQQEFDLPESTIKHLKKDIVADLLDPNSARSQQYIRGMRKYARAQYNATQDYLKRKGIKSVPLCRGAGVRNSKMKTMGPTNAEWNAQVADGELKTQPLNSYSTSPAIAHSFASSKNNAVLSKSEVPAERVFGCFATGMGTDYETEYVVMGGEDPVTHLTWKPNRRYLGRSLTRELLF
jgi:SPP1 gp7 family putative phage head morphogenesis protein